MNSKCQAISISDLPALPTDSQITDGLTDVESNGPVQHQQPADAVKEISNNIPDGGSEAWLSLLGSWCVLFCTFGLINCIGTFQGYYQKTLLEDYSASTVSWIPSLQIFLAYVTNPFTGRVFDLYGPRYLLIFGSLLEVLGLMMTSLSAKYYQLLLSQGICTALGMSAIYQPATACVAGWFDKRRGLAYGIATSGASLGGVVLPILISRLIPKLGFPWAMRIMAFVVLAMLSISNLTLKSRLPHGKRLQSRQSLISPFLDIKLMLVYIGFLVLTFGVFVPINYIVVESQHHGLTFELAQYLVATMNAGSFFGRISAGMVADRAGAYNTFVAVSGFAGILVLALYINATSSAAIFVFSVAFGFASGAYIAMITPLIVKISPLPEVGYRTGLVFFVSSFSGLVTNPIAGSILERWHGSFTGMKIFSGIMLLGGAAIVLVSRLMSTQWKLAAIF